MLVAGGGGGGAAAAAVVRGVVARARMAIAKGRRFNDFAGWLNLSWCSTDSEVRQIGRKLS